MSSHSSNKPTFYKRIVSPLFHAFLSPLTGSSSACRFSPTCSEYFSQSVAKYGIIHGSLKGIWRIIRCNPLSHGGIDLP